MNEYLIFVYGTLKRNCGNDFYLYGSEFLGEGTTKGELYLFPVYHIPFLTDGKRDIKGEVYLVDVETLRSIYFLETNAGYYREIVKVNLKGKIVDCITFKFNKAGLGYCKRLKEYRPIY